jgi:hypothetical protein
MANPLAEIKKVIELGAVDSPEASAARVEALAKQLQGYSAPELEQVSQLITDVAGAQNKTAAINAARAEVAKQPREAGADVVTRRG